MDKVEVGTIECYPVYYIPDANQVYCKNTALSLTSIRAILKSPLDRHEIPSKNMVVTKTGATITLGCLNTTIENLHNINKNINKYNNNGK